MNPFPLRPSHRGVLSRQNPGVFTEVQMQQGVGVVVTRAQRLGQRNHTYVEETRQNSGEMQDEGSEGRINNFSAS